MRTIFLMAKEQSALPGKEENIAHLRTIQDAVIVDFNGIVLVKQVDNIIHEIVGAETSLRRAQIVDASCNPHICQRERCLNGVVHKLEERRLCCRGQGVVDAR